MWVHVNNWQIYILVFFYFSSLFFLRHLDIWHFFYYPRSHFCIILLFFYFHLFGSLHAKFAHGRVFDNRISLCASILFETIGRVCIRGYVSVQNNGAKEKKKNYERLFGTWRALRTVLILYVWPPVFFLFLIFIQFY